jgi:hypothetical protein
VDFRDRTNPALTTAQIIVRHLRNQEQKPFTIEVFERIRTNPNARCKTLPASTNSAPKDIVVNVAHTTEGGSKIVINVTAGMPADFTKLIGYDNFTILASSTAKWGTRRLRVALVLDNMGSMADAGKMGALQTRDQGPAHPAPWRCKHRRRRLCADHPVREGRQSRRRELEFGLDLLGQHRPGSRPE